MVCPYCGKELEDGFLQSGAWLLWAKRKHKLSLLPREGEDFMLAEKPWLGGAAAQGHYCPACRKIIVDLDELKLPESN